MNVGRELVKEQLKWNLVFITGKAKSKKLKEWALIDKSRGMWCIPISSKLFWLSINHPHIILPGEKPSLWNSILPNCVILLVLFSHQLHRSQKECFAPQNLICTLHQLQDSNKSPDMYHWSGPHAPNFNTIQGNHFGAFLSFYTSILTYRHEPDPGLILSKWKFK